MPLFTAGQSDQRASLLRGKKALWPTGGRQNVGRHLLIVVVQQPAGRVRELYRRAARHPAAHAAQPGLIGPNAHGGGLRPLQIAGKIDCQPGG